MELKAVHISLFSFLAVIVLAALCLALLYAAESKG